MGCFWSRPLSPLGALVRVSESLGLTALSLASACAQAEALGLRGTFSLVVAIDFTRSNLENGERTFARASLHTIADDGGDGGGAKENHYEAVLASIAPLQALRSREGQESAPEPEPILVYGFGDQETRDARVFDFMTLHDRAPTSVRDVVARYREIAPSVVLSGPTSFVHALSKAAARVDESERACVLVLVCDDPPQRYRETLEALVCASRLALYVVCVGVGDAPFVQLAQLVEDARSACAFPNFAFVHYTSESRVRDETVWRARVGARVVAGVAQMARAAKEAKVKFA